MSIYVLSMVLDPEDTAVNNTHMVSVLIYLYHSQGEGRNIGRERNEIILHSNKQQVINKE